MNKFTYASVKSPNGHPSATSDTHTNEFLPICRQFSILPLPLFLLRLVSTLVSLHSFSPTPSSPLSPTGAPRPPPLTPTPHTPARLAAFFPTLPLCLPCRLLVLPCPVSASLVGPQGRGSPWLTGRGRRKGSFSHWRHPSWHPVKSQSRSRGNRERNPQELEVRQV